MNAKEAPILAAMFLDLLGFGMLIPDVQLRAQALGAPGWLIGAILASMFVVQFVASPRWGALSDRVGRKPVLVACSLLSAAAMLVYAAAGSLLLIFLSRVVAGLGAANVAVAQAHLADTTEGPERTAAMGRVGAAISSGLIAGPALGGMLADAGGNRLLGTVAGCASLVGALLIAFGLRYAPPTAERRPGKPPILDLRLVRENPSLTPLLVVAAVAWFALATLEGTFGRLIQAKLGMGTAEFGWIFSYESLLGVVVQGLLLAWVVKRVREPSLLRMAYVAQGIGLALTPFSPGLAVLFVCSTVYALGSSLANPTVSSLCSKLTPDDRQGELFGLMQTARSVGFVLGPILGGQLFDWRPEAPYLLAGGVCVAAALLVRVPPR